MSTVSFTLTDSKNRPHAYEVLLHPAEEGGPISMRLMALGLDPLAALAAAAMGSKAGAKALDIDLSAINPEEVISGMRQLLVGPDAWPLVKKILRHTRRDDTPLDSALPGEGLDVYQGNYWELYQAVWEVVKANRFLPLDGISDLIEQGKQLMSQSLSGGSPAEA